MNPLEMQLAKNLALAENTSLSRWLNKLVQEKTTHQSKGWPADFWDMAGAWRDVDFPDVAQMRANEPAQTPREPF